MKTTEKTQKKDINAGGLLLTGIVFFVGCIMGEDFLPNYGFLVGAGLAIMCLIVAPHLDNK